MRYDPERAPDPGAWLGLDEQERIRACEAHHREARTPLPNVAAHAVVHALVENQVALGVPATVRTMARLAAAGVSRHDAVHAVGSVVAEVLHAALREEAATTAQAMEERLAAGLDRLDPEDWRAD